MARGALVHLVADYAGNWLAEHREMPTGVHQAQGQQAASDGVHRLANADRRFTTLHGLRDAPNP